MDDTTADLILKLQLQDLADLQGNHKGKAKEREDQLVSDSRVAMELYIEELRRSATTFSDQRLGRSVGEANESNEELQALTDSATPSFDEMLAHFANFTMRGENERTSGIPHGTLEESPSSSGHIAPTPLAAIAGCVSCQEGKAISELMLAPCDHLYCRACINISSIWLRTTNPCFLLGAAVKQSIFLLRSPSSPITCWLGST